MLSNTCSNFLNDGVFDLSFTVTRKQTYKIIKLNIYSFECTNKLITEITTLLVKVK